jgi:hypothetical protein
VNRDNLVQALVDREDIQNFIDVFVKYCRTSEYTYDYGFSWLMRINSLIPATYHQLVLISLPSQKYSSSYSRVYIALTKYAQHVEGNAVVPPDEW